MVDMTAEVPRDLKYTADHAWVRIDGSQVTVGLTQFAARQLGEIVMTEVPAVGVELAGAEAFGTVESVKAVSEVYMPVSGTIAEVNATLSDSPEFINDDPYGDGWLVKITVSDATELKGLLDAESYENAIKSAEE